jgi:hypothetical protein
MGVCSLFSAAVEKSLEDKEAITMERKINNGLIY